MLHYHGDRVGIVVEGDVEFVVGELCDGPIGQAFVGLEGVDEGGEKFRGSAHWLGL